MRRSRPVSAEELDRLGAEPAPGEIWLCEGNALHLNDGGKTRPVLVVHAGPQEALVIPLTSRKPAGVQIAVTHQGGLSWLMTDQQRSVPHLALLHPRGAWSGFTAWQRGF